MSKKIILFIGALALVVLLSGAGCNSTIYDDLGATSASPSGQVSGKSIDQDELIGNSIYRGLQNAKVTIVEFGDFQCPACVAAAPEVKKVLEKYPNDVRLVFRNFPLSYHENAKPAAYAFEASAKQGKPWEMFDLLYENSSKLNDDIYVQFAQQLNLDIDKFKADMALDEVKKNVDDDYNYGTQINLQGTPTFYINGVEFSGSNTVDGFSVEIDKILKN